MKADVTLQTSQPAYEVGELVVFTLTNDTERVITLPHAIGWWQIEDAQGLLVGGCLVQPTERDLFPGQSLTDDWDQHSCPEGQQVPQGRYLLEVSYWDEGCHPQTCSVATYFDIGSVSVEPTSWGRVKELFSGR